MTTKPVWHDEIKTVHYHKLTNELIPGEQPTLHGTTDDETNKRYAGVYNNDITITNPK